MNSSRLTLGLFLIYMAVLVWIILFKFGIEVTYTEQRDEFNLIPYQRPLMLNGQVSYGELILNVLVFFLLDFISGHCMVNGILANPSPYFPSPACC